MLNSAFIRDRSLRDHLKLTTVPYRVSSKLWSKFQLKGSTLNISFDNWESIKYLNSSADSFNSDIIKVPKDSGGLYLFYVKCPIIPGLTEYPFYIGRAKLTKYQNLRKRVKEYFYNYKSGKDRPKINTMFDYWGEDLFLSFLPLDDNDIIEDLEEILINSLLLPMNEEIPDKTVKDSVKAFPS